jgi:hypothetical protein
VRDSHGETRTVSIVGVDRIDTNREHTAGVADGACLIKAREAIW